jgi:chromosome segregation ATPase
MTTDRLERIESILAAVTESQQRTQQQQEMNMVEIAAMREQQQEADQSLRNSIAATNEQLGTSIAETVGMISDLAEQQQATDQRFEALRQQQAETDQRFTNLFEDAREDRKQAAQARADNEREHQAFRESFQSLLAEIRAIWQRLAG